LVDLGQRKSKSGARLRREKNFSMPFRRRLYTRSEIAPGRMILRRLAIVLGLICLVFVVFWLDRDGLRDLQKGEVSFVGVVYFTFVTVTTVGYGDIVPVSDRARLIDALLVTPIRLFVLILFVGTAYELVLQRTLEDFRMRRLQRKLKGHVVVCGFGLVGRSAADELVLRDMEPSSVVAIDLKPERLEAAAERGYLGISGDITDPEVLRDAAIETARAVLVCTGRDDTNTLACLAIRSTAPDVRVVVAVRNPRQTRLLSASGASIVISPSGLGGRLMADALSDASVADVVSDLMSAGGDVVLRQRPAAPAEVGLSPRAVTDSVIVALRRGGNLYWTWQPNAEIIQAGDILVLVESCRGGKTAA